MVLGPPIKCHSDPTAFLLLHFALEAAGRHGDGFYRVGSADLSCPSLAERGCDAGNVREDANIARANATQGPERGCLEKSQAQGKRAEKRARPAARANNVERVKRRKTVCLRDQPPDILLFL